MGAAVKRVGPLALHIGGFGFKFQLHSWFQLPANTHPGKQQIITQVTGFLPPLWGDLDYGPGS